MVQARMVKAALMDTHGLGDDDIAIVPVKTTGDKVQDRPLAEIGGKALWTKELDRALGEGQIDFAVHSMKDVRERLIGADSVENLPKGARIGTSSPRRAAQLLSLRPDLNIQTLRGNVATRLAAVENGTVDATLLAAAGLDRLGHGDIGTGIPVDTLLPAAQQGAIGIETLAENDTVRSLLNGISDQPAFQCIEAERTLLDTLGADCHSPVAALAQIEDGVMMLTAELLLHDGSERVGQVARGPVDTRVDMAENMARALLDEASPALRALFAG
jgi:hydroxymethylbilane synthase